MKEIALIWRENIFFIEKSWFKYSFQDFIIVFIYSWIKNSQILFNFYLSRKIFIQYTSNIFSISPLHFSFNFTILAHQTPTTHPQISLFHSTTHKIPNHHHRTTTRHPPQIGNYLPNFQTNLSQINESNFDVQPQKNPLDYPPFGPWTVHVLFERHYLKRNEICAVWATAQSVRPSWRPSGIKVQELLFRFIGVVNAASRWNFASPWAIKWLWSRVQLWTWWPNVSVGKRR